MILATTASSRMALSLPLVVNWGGGTNSTALLVGMHERGIRPDLVIFADTRSEMPHTYAMLEPFREWLRMAHDLDLVVVCNADRDGFPHASLEEECLHNATLPGLAFGFRGCSAKWKLQPMGRYEREWPPAVDAWARGEKVTKAIGFDFFEERRASVPEDDHYRYVYPLIDWRWGREECVEAIARAGLPQPLKSACFFCPASKPREVIALAANHPDLYARAIAIERAAAPNLDTVKGLARKWSWESIVEADRAQLDLLAARTVDIACMCFDGDDDE